MRCERRLAAALALLFGSTEARATPSCPGSIVTATGNSGSGSLRDCITLATSGTTINFSVSSVTLTAALPSVPANVKIDGGGSVTISGSGSVASAFAVTDLDTIVGLAIHNFTSYAVVGSGDGITIGEPGNGNDIQSTSGGRGIYIYGPAAATSDDLSIVDNVVGSGLSGHHLASYGIALADIGGTSLVTGNVVLGVSSGPGLNLLTSSTPPTGCTGTAPPPPPPS